MGTGNIEIACECSHVPISSVDLAEEEIALKAAQVLDRLMRGRTQPQRPIVIAPRGVVIRSSTEFLAVASPLLRRAVDFVSTNLRRPFSREQVAESAGVSRRTLYNLFQRHLARSPAEFVLKARLDRARQLVDDRQSCRSERLGLAANSHPPLSSIRRRERAHMEESHSQGRAPSPFEQVVHRRYPPRLVHFPARACPPAGARCPILPILSDRLPILRVYLSTLNHFNSGCPF